MPSLIHHLYAPPTAAYDDDSVLPRQDLRESIYNVTLYSVLIKLNEKLFV